MNLGRMNQFIDIISITPVKDKEGFSAPGETVLASVRAYKEDRHGSLMWANRASFSTATALFRFRKIPGLKLVPSLYIACPDGRYKILSVEDVKGRGMYWEILTSIIEP